MSTKCAWVCISLRLLLYTVFDTTVTWSQVATKGHILIISFSTIIARDSHQLKTSNKHLASIYFHEEKEVKGVANQPMLEGTIIVILITLYQNVVQWK